MARFIAAFGMQMLVTALDWETLQTRRIPALALGFVGLSLMVPMILCTLPAGHLADRRNRKKHHPRHDAGARPAPAWA